MNRYKNKAAMQTHVKSAYFREFAAKVPGLVERPMEMRMGGLLGTSTRVSRM